MSYSIKFTPKAVKDIERLKKAGLVNKVKHLISVIKNNPFTNYPPYEKLVGDLHGLYSRRINIQHRLVYMVDEKNKTIRVLRMWNHYE